MSVGPGERVRGGADGAALLLAQAQFDERSDESGTLRITPGPAKLTIAHLTGQGWTREVVEDPESNVFHRALPVELPGERAGVLTLGGNPAPQPALLKLWNRTPAGLNGTTLARVDFRHRFNRFRDVEIGDVTGDGVPELVVATHDQGVVAVLQRGPDRSWQLTEIDRTTGTFVHEIELADLDGDGRTEVIATPTEPNRMDRGTQPGRIVRYTFEDGGWVASPVAIFPDRHAKEILAVDLEGVGRADLFAAVECPPTTTVTRIRLVGGAWTYDHVATLPSDSCRFLCAGDVDGDGREEMVAACSRSGIWLLRPGTPRWKVELIDDASTAVELATTLADLDRDGIQEIYVAADDQRQLRSYRWRNGRFDREDLLTLEPGDMTFGLDPCTDGHLVPGL